MTDHISQDSYSELEERAEREWPAGLNVVKKVDKPWGYELVWARTNIYGGKIIHVEEGHQLSLQYHVKKDETMYLNKGRIMLEVEDSSGNMQSIEMVQGQSYRIVPGTKHRVLALETSDILEVSTAHYDDIVRLKDDYGRA